MTGRGLRGFLTPERLRRVAICLFVMNVGLYAAVVALGKFPSDALHTVVAQDFLGHLTGGILVATGRRGELYDVPAQYALQVALTHRPEYLDVFISPPLVAFFYAPFALLGYGTGVALWLAISGCLLAACAVLLVRLMPNVPRETRGLLLLLAVASHPTIQLLGSGQDTAASLLLWSGGVLLALRKREWASGLVFSLGLFKPQLFLMPPVLFLLWGRWRALAVWTASALAQGALTLALVGTGGVRAWIAILRSPAYLDFLQNVMAPKMTSLVPFFHSLVPEGWGEVARGVGLTASAAVVLAALWRIRAGTAQANAGGAGALDERAAWALACLTTLIASPHLFYYDLTLAALPVALFLDVNPELSRTARNALFAVYVLCWLAPVRVAFAHAPWPANVLNASWLPIPLLFLWKEIASVRGTFYGEERLSTQGTRPSC
jgi:hypothetical protein